MSEDEWPPDEWPDMSDRVFKLRSNWWSALTVAQREQVIHRGWTIHNIVGMEAVNERAPMDVGHD